MADRYKKESSEAAADLVFWVVLTASAGVWLLTNGHLPGLRDWLITFSIDALEAGTKTNGY